jgi:hypothetical protein
MAKPKYAAFLIVYDGYGQDKDDSLKIDAWKEPIGIWALKRKAIMLDEELKEIK